LFRELFVATKDDRWRELELACAKSVMSSGLPEQRLPGFWNNVGRCCGDAGVIEFKLDLFVETNDAQYLDFARRVGRDVLSRATSDEHGMRWIQAENRTQPDNLVAQTGLMQGAAGIGLALVHLDEVERGIERSVHLPDEPPR
jgi:lantibiotic modifying enzyme